MAILKSTREERIRAFTMMTYLWQNERVIVYAMLLAGMMIGAIIGFIIGVLI